MKCLSVRNMMSAGQRKPVWYQCNEHGICSAVSEVSRQSVPKTKEDHIQSAHPWAFTMKNLVESLIAVVSVVRTRQNMATGLVTAVRE